jgi:hypothetical protein
MKRHARRFARYPCWNLLAPYFTATSRIDGSLNSQPVKETIQWSSSTRRVIA